MAIHDLRIHRDGDSDDAPVSCVSLRFGDGHALEVVARNGQARLILRTPHVAAELAADGYDNAFERAVNLLRLYMPAVGRARVD
jgi:hypothetical protein